MNDLDYLSKNLDEFKQLYPKFVMAISPLIDAFSTAAGVSEVTTHKDYVVLRLCRLSFDRFEDVLILCFQRRGEGAMPLMRVMFEGLVNARYIKANPDNYRPIEDRPSLDAAPVFASQTSR